MNLETWLQDVRYAFRTVRRAPGFAGAAIATIALGIGANTAIFSVVHAMLLKPLPYPQPNELVMVWQDFRGRGGPIDEWATPGNFVDWRAERSIFSSLASIRGWGPTLSGMGDPEPVRGEQVSQGYFDVLRTTPALGRLFVEADGIPNAPRVVVMSHATWLRRFAGDRGVIGRRITLAGEPHEIVGVLPEGFRPIIVSTAEFWRPERFNLANPSRGAIVLRIVARLQPGATLASVAPAVDTLAKQLEQRYPDSNTGVRLNVVRLHEQVVGAARPGLLALLGAVVLVLLIACVNVANLLLARASGRTREMAVRTALGAGRVRVVRQLLTESGMLALVGGIVGVGLGVLGTKALVALAPHSTPRLNEVGLNWWILAFAMALTLLTGALFGLAPALQAARGNHTPALKEGGRGTAGAAGQRTRRLLIVAEVAVALVLLIGSGLLLRSFLAMQRSDLGFDPERVLTGFVSVTPGRFKSPDDRIAFQDRLLDRVRALPGVTHAAVSSVLPLDAGDSDMGFEVEGAPPRRPGEPGPGTWYRVVSHDYFKAMGIEIQTGRGFEPREATPSVVVNEELARRFWPDQTPLGKRIRFESNAEAPWFTIIGVAADVKQTGARSNPRMQTFIPYWQFPQLAGGTNVVLKTAVAPESVAPTLRQAVREMDPDQPISGILPMSTRIVDSVREPRFLALITGIFAVLAVLLAAIGVYGVTAYAVTQRVPEIGVRLALGARPRDVFFRVLSDGLRLTTVGVVIGGAAALVLAPMLATLLFGIGPADPLTLAVTSGGLLLIAAIATFLPARRATKIDPVVALRAE